MGFFETITSFDSAVLVWLQTVMQSAFCDNVMAFFSILGEKGIFWLSIGCVMLFFKKTRATGAMLIAAVAFGFLIGEVCLKNIICRPRPFEVNPNIRLNISPPSGYSCPSGHSCSSFAAAVVLTAKNKKLGIPALLIAVLIAFSRLYNGVHYPSDVLFGIMLGVASAITIMIIFSKTGIEQKLSGKSVKRC